MLVGVQFPIAVLFIERNFMNKRLRYDEAKMARTKEEIFTPEELARIERYKKPQVKPRNKAFGSGVQVISFAHHRPRLARTIALFNIMRRPEPPRYPEQHVSINGDDYIVLGS